MQDNNKNNDLNKNSGGADKPDNIDKSPKESSDEIIEILNNYRRSNSPKEPDKKPEPVPQKAPVTPKRSEAPKKPVRNVPDDSTKTRFIQKVENNDVKKPAISRLTNPSENAADRPAGAFTNPHLSDKISPEVLQKAQSLNGSERLSDVNVKEVKKSKKLFMTLGKGTFLFKALFYILFVVVISAYLSYFVISVGNDVFALVKEDTSAKITVAEGTTIDSIADTLSEKGIINHAWLFKLYLKYRSDTEYSFIPGEHDMSAKMNYSQIITELTVKYAKREIVSITIPEGFTIDEIINMLVEKGVGTKEGYVDAINNYKYKWPFVQELEKIGYSADRKYRLEGYLYPDTYDFYTDDEEYRVINKMLDNFNTKFWIPYEDDYKNVLKNFKPAMTFDDLITLASMIEAEGNNIDDFGYISHVFHNRLENPNAPKKLQSDATIQYVLPKREEDLTAASKNLDSPYNTYNFEGLPPGAICNPGQDAIWAALFPEKPSIGTAFYFVSNKAGKTYYALKLDGHNANIAKVKKDNEAIKNGTYTG